MRFCKIDNCLDNTKFKMNEKYYPIQAQRRTAENLFHLASFAINEQPLPEAFQWNIFDVLTFIAKLGLPQYKKTFWVNKIDGKSMLFLDATALCRMNIKNFDHIIKITKAIRDLYKIEKILFKRSISLPPRYPETHYKYFKVTLECEHVKCKRTDLWAKMNIINEYKNLNHFEKLHAFYTNFPHFNREIIGYTPRPQLYYVKKKSAKEPLPMLEKVPCTCTTPCECQWTNRDLREPWTLEYLLRDSAPNVQSDDILVAASNKKTPEPCTCIPPCECLWTKRDFHKPFIFTVLRKKGIQDDQVTPRQEISQDSKSIQITSESKSKTESNVKQNIQMPCNNRFCQCKFRNYIHVRSAKGLYI